MADLVPSATHFYVQGHENVSKTQDKLDKVVSSCQSLLEQEVIGIRQLASVVGLLESFVSADTQHDLLRLDNATAVAYVNHVGGTRSPDLAALALEMWSWALERGLTLSATHVPGLTNTLADKNAQLKEYVSWRPEPEAILVFKVLRKVQSDVAIVILIPPVWESQAWYPKVLNMLFESPVLLPQSWDLLFLPHNRRPHPLLPDLMLAAWPRSGDSCRVGAFRQGLQTSSSRLGEKALLDSISQHGLRGQLDRRLCAFTYLKEYLRRTSSLRKEGGGEQRLFISFSRPHRPVGSATLARWVKSVLGTAGVDTATFSAHSTRGASTSAATAAGVSLHSIMNAADWSRESTFLKYYRRDNNQHTFDQAVLSTALKSA
ncbi:hypothetical protein Bbelb_087560 [Branchiostoma belcheri]|nr:hypothetical protein Bbelb_087560 [Branchiostoma belcheri]